MEEPRPLLLARLKNLVIGKARNPQDRTIFHKISLIALFAWIGLGADGLSSSCYGPQESFLALNGHPYLGIFVALGTVLTIFIISASYSQIVELFPHGGGGYLVASKLLSPNIGMLSGCALLIDYVLTIAVSVASGADAIFSLLPLEWHSYRLGFAIFIVLVLIILNMRGVKESVVVLAPIFLIFLITHVFIITYALSTHLSNFKPVITATALDVKQSISEVGFFGMMFLVLRAYSMGAGTYTGLEAVSNGVPILREPQVDTAKKTMRYMAISLSFVAMGLMLSYLFYNVSFSEGKTLNAILFERATAGWGSNSGYLFILIALLSEATLLFVAAQTGFLDGPRVLSNMALDRWFPTRFSTLSDRFVIQNGILIMGGVALAMMILTRGSVHLLVILYSINVFITFVLSQLGMVRHWWSYRHEVKTWVKKLAVNGIGLIATAFILTTMIVLKFNEGGWVTLLITGGLVTIAVLIKRHYIRISKILRRLNSLVTAAIESPESLPIPGAPINPDYQQKPDFEAKTAVILVNGFNGMGLHILFNVIRLFGGAFQNFVFMQVGVLDAGNFKGAHEVDRLKMDTDKNVKQYVAFMNKHGYYADGIGVIGVNIVDEAAQLAGKILERFPNAVFFGGQLIFEKESFITRLFHNYTVFTLQKRLYPMGIPFVILPVRV